MGKEKVDYIMKVNNNTMGNLFIQMMKENLNPDLKLCLRGSEPNHKKAKRDKYRFGGVSIPLKYANKIRIYVQTKEEDGMYSQNLGANTVGNSHRNMHKVWESEDKLRKAKDEIAKVVNAGLDCMDMMGDV